MFVEFSPVGSHRPGSPVAAMRSWAARDVWVGLAFAVLAIIGVVGVLAVVQVGLDLEGEAADVMLVAATLAIELLLGLWVLAAARRRGLSSIEIGLVRPHQWWPMWVAWLGSYGILLGYALLLRVAEGVGLPVGWISDTNRIPIDVRSSLPVMIVLGVTVIVAAPVCEELFFRGLIFRGMRGFWRPLTAMLVSGAFFGIFHTNLGVLLPFSLIGALFAWASDESGSLFAPIGAHFAVNTVSFALTVAGVVP